jgi:hypothetical protein
VVGHYVLQFFEPKIGHLRQHGAFVGNAGWQYYVEGRQPVCANEQHGVCIDFINVAHFTLVYAFKAG